jgi:hypothetical protein
VTSRLRIVVSGLIAQYPLGGVAWDYGQYAQGLARLGHEVFYVEDTGLWPYNPAEAGVSKTCDYNVRYLARVMSSLGLDGHWAYRFPWESQWFGLPRKRVREIVESADLIVNVSGSLHDPKAYAGRGVLALIDSDPVFTQVKLARGQQDFRAFVDAHDVHFTFGETLPDEFTSDGPMWRPTRQPVVLSEWLPAAATRDVFTTVMNWTSYKPVTFEGRTFGQKDVELERFVDLPTAVAPTRLELAVNDGKTRRTPRSLLEHHGWALAHPDVVCSDMEAYRDYVRTSKAEWSVAKNGYVVGRSGWFSCRSACYLAAGRPVVLQDTGFSDVLPVGEGVLAFDSLEEAAAGIRSVEADYARHSRAATEIAHEFFDSDRVLELLVEEAMGVHA